jgi:DNA replication and repair protein RecF
MDRALLRASYLAGDREIDLSAEIRPTRSSLSVRGKRIRTKSEVTSFLRVTTFSPADLDLVQGPPAGRRELLDDLLLLEAPSVELQLRQLERSTRQRNAFLKQVRGSLRHEDHVTLDVWDTRLAIAGEQVVAARESLARRLGELSAEIYARMTRSSSRTRLVELAYRRSWEGELFESLQASRGRDLLQQSTSVGPHRDEMNIFLRGMMARTHASQGEQRSIALALRLASHSVAGQASGRPPILILDDVFSELDEHRTEALIEQLPPGQALVSTANSIPAKLEPFMAAQIQVPLLIEQVPRAGGQ